MIYDPDTNINGRQKSYSKVMYHLGAMIGLAPEQVWAIVDLMAHGPSDFERAWDYAHGVRLCAHYV